MPGSKSYWNWRAAREAYEMYEESESLAKDLANAYQKASGYMSHQAEGIFNKYRDKYNLSEEEARRLISQVRDKSSIRNLLNTLRGASDKKAAKDIRMELESAAYRARIVRYGDLQLQLDDIMKNIYQQELRKTTDFYKHLARDGYYKTMFGIQQRTGLGFSFSHIDHKQIDRILSANWSGKDYSRRIWGNTRQLAETLKTELAVSLVTGRTERDTARIISEQFAHGAMQARRLVRTESNYVSTQANFAAYKEAGVEEYLYLATLDLRTSQICRELDGKIFPLSKQQVGVNCPPMHPWCRSTTVAVIDRELLKNLKRRARDPETGKTYLVPMTMSYKEWYEKYVAKTKSSDIIGINKEDSYIGREIMKTDNQGIREWYVANVSNIPNMIDKTKSIEEQARQAYELRTKFKHQARVAMSDRETADMLEKKRPPKSFDQLLSEKMERKHMTREEAIEDILRTASKTNEGVNKTFGIGGDKDV